MLNYLELSFSAILSGVSEDGTKYLKLFLQDVVNVLNIRQPNASCQKCLRNYYEQLTMHSIPKTEVMSQYKLLKKREGLSLEFGSQIHVTNANITDEYAEKLIERFKKVNENFKLSDLFQTYPGNEKEKKTKADPKKLETEKVETEKEPTKESVKPKLNLKAK